MDTDVEENFLQGSTLVTAIIHKELLFTLFGSKNTPLLHP